MLVNHQIRIETGLVLLLRLLLRLLPVADVVDVVLALRSVAIKEVAAVEAAEAISSGHLPTVITSISLAIRTVTSIYPRNSVSIDLREQLHEYKRVVRGIRSFVADISYIKSVFAFLD